MAIFHKNLEKATSQLLLEPDWDSVLQIVDCIRQGDVQVKVALFAIKKKIVHENPHVAVFALLVLEACVKNCGSKFHTELATKEFMEFLKDQVKSIHDPVKEKILELIQTWSHAFRNEPHYKAVEDTFHILKMEGHKFSALKEADAMFDVENAPSWKDSETCTRCRVQFSVLQRKNHCRNCGEVFCGKCSSKKSIIPKLGFERDVRVCDYCFEKINKPGQQIDDELPAVYLASPLSKPSQTNLIKELESRVKHLMTEVDSTLNQRSALEKEKNEAISKYERLVIEHDKMCERHTQLEHEFRNLKIKTEASLEYLKQEHSMLATKEMEQNHQQDKMHLEFLHEKQVRNIKKEMEQLEADSNKKAQKLEQHIKEREEEVKKLKEQKQQQSLQAEQALEDFKAQVERNQARIYDEVKQQMQQVEIDLLKSKQAREKQAKEFSRQIEEENHRHQHEMAELKVSAEGEKSQLMREFHMQKEFTLSEHEKDLESLKEIHQTEMLALEARLKENKDRAEKTLYDNERQIRELREELVQANQLHKQQLVELGLLREEEKQKIHRDQEAELSRLRTTMEQQKIELQRIHSSEMERVLEKTNERLKFLEKDSADRIKQSAEEIHQLQVTVTQLKGDLQRSQEMSDKMLVDIKHRTEEEKQNLCKQYSQNFTTIQRELEEQRNRTRHAEKLLQKKESDLEDKITQLKLQFEEIIRGLMSSSS